MPEQLRPESKDLGEAATLIPNSSFKFVTMGQHAPRANPEPQYNYFFSNIV